MNSTDSLREFFYNIIPGFLFLTGLNILLDNGLFNIQILYPLKDKEIFLSLVLVFFSLFIGFIFQGFTKFTRKYFCLNRTTFEKLANDNKYTFEKVKEILKSNDLLKDNKNDLENIFYLMHNYLEGESKGQLPKFFSLRVAFWSNIFFGSLSLFFIALCLHEDNEVIILFFMVSCYSFWLWKEYLRILYDTVLKSFTSIIKIGKYGTILKGTGGAKREEIL